MKKPPYRMKIIRRNRRLRIIAGTIDISDVARVNKFFMITKKYSPSYYDLIVSTTRKNVKELRKKGIQTSDPTEQMRHARPYDDFEYETWHRHQTVFCASPILSDYLSYMSIVPCGNQFFNRPVHEFKLVGSLIYYGGNDEDFVPVPDQCLAFIKRLFSDPCGASFFPYSIHEIEREWGRICRHENVSIHMSNLTRFAVRRLLDEHLPKRVIERICCLKTMESRYRYGFKDLEKQFWTNVIANIDLHYRGLYPKYDEFGIGNRDAALMVASLLCLSNCKVFSNLKSSDFVLAGNTVNLQKFATNGFNRLLTDRYRLLNKDDGVESGGQTKGSLLTGIA